MILYTYWRSTAAYRVRIALNFKDLRYESIFVHLVRQGGEQLSATYRAKNPNAVVPALEIDGAVLTQSLAIIEYLDEQYPTPPLLPSDGLLRARVRAAAQLISSDIHPINNLRVLQYLRGELRSSEDQTISWMRHWMQLGLTAYAQMIEPGSEFSFGNAPSIADLCLVPQLYNARRWGLDMTGLAHLQAIERNCLALEAFSRAVPEHQPDAE